MAKFEFVLKRESKFYSLYEMYKGDFFVTFVYANARGKKRFTLDEGEFSLESRELSSNNGEVYKGKFLEIKL